MGACTADRRDAHDPPREFRGGFVARADRACVLASRRSHVDRAEPAQRARRAGYRAIDRRAVLATYSGLRSRCRVRTGLAQERTRRTLGAPPRVWIVPPLRCGIDHFREDDRARLVEGRYAPVDLSTAQLGRYQRDL